GSAASSRRARGHSGNHDRNDEQTTAHRRRGGDFQSRAESTAFQAVVCSTTAENTMQIIDFSRDHASPIEIFDSISVSNVRIGGGQGETYVYCVYFKPGGSIGEHPAGYAQLFLVVDGEGWGAGADGHRIPLLAGQGA